jgi:hypothetical protein
VTGRTLIVMILSAGLLAGCGAASPHAVRTTPEPACSFRSPTTCWTLADRLPRREALPPAPDSLRAPPRAVLASAGDSTPPRR